MNKFGLYFKVWKGGGGGSFLGFEICHWGMGLCGELG
jgi:hypothetical protein